MPETPTESFGTLPHDAESFGNLRNNAEPFRTVPHHAEKTEDHTLTVREVAKRFEAAGVARTERSIINWCNLNRQGVSRLDCYYETNERRYYITLQSVERAIAEEQAKARATVNPPPEAAVPHAAEAAPGRRSQEESTQTEEGAADRFRELQKHVTDLEILNRGKDFFIERLTQQNDALITSLRKIERLTGSLQTKLVQIEGPKRTHELDLPDEDVTTPDDDLPNVPLSP